jgi:hypothetical protein
MRIVGDPDNQRPNKWISTVNAFVNFISITIYISKIHEAHIFINWHIYKDRESTDNFFFLLNNASNDNLTKRYNICGLRVY